jgi:Zn-dependent M28 family amino/carboxypeptidase
VRASHTAPVVSYCHTVALSVSCHAVIAFLTVPTGVTSGANDDGSGIAMLLELARITKAEAATYEYSLKIVAFSAEEQGLFGSTAVANAMRDAGEEIIAMYAADMIGYRVPGRNIQVGLPVVYHTPAITDLAEEAMTLYVPDMEVCEYTGCCTDNKPFCACHHRF